MTEMPVPSGTVLRVVSSGTPRMFITQAPNSMGNMVMRTAPKPMMVRTPGPTGPVGPPGGTEVYAFSGTGPEFVRTGTHWIELERPYQVESVRATVATPPLGTGLVVDVLIDGDSIWPNPSDRPTILPTKRSGVGGSTIDPPVLPVGGFMTVNVAQVGAVAPGSDLTVMVRLHPVA